MSSEKVAHQLNIILANATVQYQKLLHFHWRVEGPGFFELHQKFEELYDRFKVIVDEVAERILTIEHAPFGSLKEALHLATIKESTGVPTDTTMVQEIVHDFETQIKLMKQTCELAEDNHDRGTANLLDEIIDGLEKTNWMLHAYLQKSKHEPGSRKRSAAEAVMS
jgi:starvation-inducible DNA-binding protein